MSNDLQHVQQGLERIEAFRKDIDKLAKRCDKLVVTETTRESAGELAKEARTIENAIETVRKEIKEPILAAGKLVDEAAKKITGNLTGAISKLRAGILEYDKEVQRKLDDERRRREEEHRKEMARLEKAAERTGSAKAVAKVELAKAEHVLEIAEIKAEAPTSLRKAWKYEVTEPMDVPRSYLTVDDAAVKAAIKQGVRSIPGIRIYEEQSLALR